MCKKYQIHIRHATGRECSFTCWYICVSVCYVYSPGMLTVIVNCTVKIIKVMIMTNSTITINHDYDQSYDNDKSSSITLHDNYHFSII